MTTTTIPQTILQQLGGRRFIAMTGARDLVAGRTWLAFKLPSYFAKDGINAVRVTLDEGMDLYTLELSRIRGVKVTPVRTLYNLYWDALPAVFTRETGLHTSL